MPTLATTRASQVAAAFANDLGRRGRRRSTSLLASMPATPVGLYTMDKYAANPRPTLVNQAATTPVSQNLLSASSRQFNGPFWQRGGVTVTDGVASPIDGSNNASTVVATGGWYVSPTAPVLTPGVVYTYSIDAGTTDASTVTCMVINSQNITVTPTMQTFSKTFTYSNGMQIYGIGNVGGVAANLKIQNARLHIGSADLGRDTLDGHLMFGNYVGDTLPGTATAGLLDVSNGSGAYIQFPTVLNMNAVTVIAIGSRNTTASLGAYQSVLSQISSYSNFTVYMDDGGPSGGRLQFGGAGNPPPGLTWPSANELHALTTRYGDGSLTFFEDDAKSKYTTSSPAPSATGDFWFGWLIATSNYARYKFAALAIYTRALSDAEVRAAYYALKAYCSTTSALSISTNTKYVTAEGDSRTFGYATTDQLGGYGDRAGTSLTTAIGTTNAVSSAKLGVNGDAEAANTLWGRKARDLAVIPASKNGKLYILSILIGYTDFAGYGTNGYTQYAADVATYAAAMKAGGYDRIILCTELPSTSAGYNAWRNALNAIYTGASWTTNNGIDALCRLDQIAGMGADADASGTNYADGLHPSNAGQILIAPVWAATVNGIT